MKPSVTCRHFRGDRPCSLNPECSDACPRHDIPTSRVLLIHLGALGAVVRSTALLGAIRRKHPGCHLTWVTDAPADRLLRGHPRIDRVLTSGHDDVLVLRGLSFDVAYVIDKSMKASGILSSTTVDAVFGFVMQSTGAIVPASAAAQELWEIGLDDHRKFHVNRKPETQLVNEALELGPWRRDEYELPLNTLEMTLRDQRRSQWGATSSRFLVGLNTGCSDVIAAKKLTVPMQAKIAHALMNRGLACVLLGGPEDAERNDQIAALAPGVLRSPERSGLRDGLVSVAACDAVITGDSLGMHMAISQNCWVTAWFGPTCAHEIDLYGRGEAILTKAPCAPCWKRTCLKDPMCYDLVSPDELVEVTVRGLMSCKREIPSESSSSKRPFSEISF